MLFSTSALAQVDSVGLFYNRLMSIPQDSISYYYNNPPVSMPLLRLVRETISKNPSHRYAPFFARIELYMIDGIGQGVSIDSVKALEKQLLKYESNFKSRDWVYYYFMSGSYSSLHLIAKSAGSLALSRLYLERQEPYLKGAVIGISDTNSRQYFQSLVRLYSYYNNRANLLYGSTHQFDPVWKRNQSGPLIERDLLRADSCFAVLRQYPEFFCEDLDYRHYNNLVLLYGAYYRNDLKAQLYLQQFKDNVALCNGYAPLDQKKFEFIKFQTYKSWGWVLFANRDFASAIQVIRRSLLFVNNSIQQRFNFDFDSSTLPDFYYALSQSYYNSNNYDSAIFFGEKQVQDTTNYKDYLYLTETTAMLAELYADRDVGKAMGYLKLSNRFRKSVEHEVVYDDLINEGKQIALNQVNQKIQKLTNRLEQGTSVDYRLYFWLTLFAFGLLLIFISIRRYITVLQIGNRLDNKVKENDALRWIKEK